MGNVARFKNAFTILANKNYPDDRTVEADENDIEYIKNTLNNANIVLYGYLIDEKHNNYKINPPSEFKFKEITFNGPYGNKANGKNTYYYNIKLVGGITKRLNIKLHASSYFLYTTKQECIDEFIKKLDNIRNNETARFNDVISLLDESVNLI